MKKIIFLLSILLSFCSLYAQTGIVYDLEPGMEQIQERNIKVWQKVKYVQGYRVQIASFSGTNSLASAEKAKSNFEEKFPNYSAYIVYMEPYFCLRVGDFTTKIQAYHAFRRIKPIFEGAFLVKDKVNFLSE